MIWAGVIVFAAAVVAYAILTIDDTLKRSVLEIDFVIGAHQWQ